MLSTFSLVLRRSLIAIPAILTIAPQALSDEAQPKFACLIEPKMVLKLGTQVPGLISEVLVDRGAFVKKGDIVARLESGVEAASMALAQARAENETGLQSARARLDFQVRKAERATELRKHDNIPISTADEAETGAKVADAELHEAAISKQLAQLEFTRTAEVLKQRTILSPIDGVVVERTLGPGEYAYDQSHLMTIAEIDPLNVEVYAPLSEFGHIRTGMPAEIVPEDPIGGKYDAAVTVVDQVFDAASGTFGVRVELPNPHFALPAGIKCHIRFPGVS